MEIIHQQSEPIPCHPSPPNPRDKGHTVTRSTKRSRVYVDAISWGCTVTIITRLATTSFNVRGKNKIQIAASIGNNGNWIVQRDVQKQRPSRPGHRGTSCPVVVVVMPWWPLVTFCPKRMTERKKELFAISLVLDWQPDGINNSRCG